MRKWHSEKLDKKCTTVNKTSADKQEKNHGCFVKSNLRQHKSKTLTATTTTTDKNNADKLPVESIKSETKVFSAGLTRKFSRIAFKKKSLAPSVIQPDKGDFFLLNYMENY